MRNKGQETVGKLCELCEIRLAPSIVLSETSGAKLAGGAGWRHQIRGIRNSLIHTEEQTHARETENVFH